MSDIKRAFIPVALALGVVTAGTVGFAKMENQTSSQPDQAAPTPTPDPKIYEIPKIFKKIGQLSLAKSDVVKILTPKDGADNYETIIIEGNPGVLLSCAYGQLDSQAPVLCRITLDEYYAETLDKGKIYTLKDRIDYRRGKQRLFSEDLTLRYRLVN